MSQATILFWIIAAFTGLSAVAVLVSQNIVRSAVWLLFTLGFTTALVIVGVTRGFHTRDERIAFLLAVLALFGAMQSYPIPNEFRYAIGLSPAYGLLIYAMLRPAGYEGRAAMIIAARFGPPAIFAPIWPSIRR